MSVGAFERKTSHFRTFFNLVLFAGDEIQTRVSLSEPLQRSVIGEGWADENDVIKLATRCATELVHKKLRLARVRRTNN